MTATHETLARPASLTNAATAIFAALGLITLLSLVPALPCTHGHHLPIKADVRLL
jgi:hypothetical protein